MVQKMKAIKKTNLLYIKYTIFVWGPIAGQILNTILSGQMPVKRGINASAVHL